MISLLVQAIILILLWYSSWTLISIAENDLTKGEDTRLSFAFNVVLFILGIFILWIALSIEGLIT